MASKTQQAKDLAAYCRATVRDAHERGCTGTRITFDFMCGVAQAHPKTITDTGMWVFKRAARIIVDCCQTEGTLGLVDFSDAPFAIRPRR